VNEALYEARRNAILDAAKRAVATKGYERMAIADLLSELQISSGAFYHYFESKPALLVALVEHIADQVEQLVLPIIHNPELHAIEKLQQFFTTVDREKLAHKRLVLEFLRVWYGDENAIVRQKLYVSRVKRFTPWLEEIIRQGVEEGRLTTPYPDQAARIIFALFEDIGLATVDLLLAPEHGPDALPRLERIIECGLDAIERVLGAPHGCLQLTSPEELALWLRPQSEEDKEQASGLA
jgi:AcrR family transcriptional regulator